MFIIEEGSNTLDEEAYEPEMDVDEDVVEEAAVPKREASAGVVAPDAKRDWRASCRAHTGERSGGEGEQRTVLVCLSLK